MRADGDDDAIERLAQRAEILDRRLQANLAAAIAHELGGRLGKEARQIDARQQQIARFWRTAQRLAQHGEEDVGGGELGRRIERRDAQRPPQEMRNAAVLPVLREQLGHR